MTLDEGIIHAEDVARNNHEAAIYLADEHPTQAEKCEECAREHEQLAEWLKELKAYKEQSGDAISRQAVLDAFWKLNVELSPTAIWTIQNMVKDVPSITPQQRTGRWIKQNYGWNWQCSECRFVTPPSAKEIFTFCPGCGCKMEVEE